MKKLAPVLLLLICSSSYAFSQGPPPPPGLCPSFSSNIVSNGNGSFTAASAQAYYWEILSGNANINSGGTSQTVQISCNTDYELKVTRFVGGNCYEDCISVQCTSNPCQYTINMERPMCYEASTACRGRSGQFSLSNPCFSSLTADWEVVSSGGCAATSCLNPSAPRFYGVTFRPTTVCDIAGQTVTINAYQPNTNNLWATTTTMVGYCDLLEDPGGKANGTAGSDAQFEIQKQGQMEAIATDLLTGQQFTLQHKTVQEGERLDLKEEYRKLENGHLYDIRIMLDGEVIQSRKIRMD